MKSNEVFIFTFVLLITTLRPLVILFWYFIRSNKSTADRIILLSLNDKPAYVEQQKKREFKGNIVSFLTDFVLVIAACYCGILTISSEFSFTKKLILDMMWQFPLHFLVLEFLYYWYHRLQHQYKFLYKFHLYHHKSIITNPETATSFNIIDRVGLTPLFIIPFFIISQITNEPISPILFILTALFHDVMNIAGHVNFEVMPKWWCDNNVLNKVLYSTRHHALHHTKFNCNYSLFCPFFDWLFNSTCRESLLPKERSENKVD